MSAILTCLSGLPGVGSFSHLRVRLVTSAGPGLGAFCGPTWDALVVEHGTHEARLLSRNLSRAARLDLRDGRAPRTLRRDLDDAGEQSVGGVGPT